MNKKNYLIKETIDLVEKTSDEVSCIHHGLIEKDQILSDFKEVRKFIESQDYYFSSQMLEMFDKMLGEIDFSIFLECGKIEKK